jgi:hypothetical protein
MRILILLLSLPLFSVAQHAIIKGVAPLSQGQEIQLRVLDDPITGKERILASQKIDVDGSFELKVVPNGVQYAILQIGRNCADFYIEREKDLELSFVPPADDQLKPKAFNERQFFIPKITGGSGKKLNDEILAFNDSLDGFLEKIYPVLKQRKSPGLLTGEFIDFQKSMFVRYSKSGQFVYDYVRYSLAIVEQTFVADRELQYKNYQKNAGKDLNNPAYIDFLLQFFEGAVRKMILLNRNEECLKALKGLESIAKLDQILLEEEPLLSDVSARRLVLLDGLNELFGYKEIDAEKLTEDIRRFGMLSSNSYIGNAARNIADMHSRLSKGNKVPDIAYVNHKGAEQKLSELIGRYMFIEFTDATNVYSNRETNVIPNLKDEFKNIRFVTICVGNTEREMLNLKKKMNIDWELGRIDVSNPAIEDFQIRSLPQFFIIDPDGNFYAAPAKDPTKGAQQELMALSEKLKAKGRRSVGK